MIWALLAILGVPIWLVLGALAGALLSRRAVKTIPGTMRARFRVLSGSAPGLKERWPRSSGYAVWVHDILVVHVGLALVRTRLLPVSTTGEIERRSQPELKRLGGEQAVLGLVLEDGSNIELAVAITDRSALPGPFLLAEGNSAQRPALPNSAGQ
jgi:hypothetical protein